MDAAGVYGEARARLLGLAPGLDGVAAGTPVNPTPAWRVADVYAHLSGVCADVLDGHLEGAGSPEWTASQVASRRGTTLAGVADEWAARGPELDVRLRSAPSGALQFLAFDVWTHEQDIRAAVGLTGRRADERVGDLAAAALAVFDRRFREGSTPPLRVVTERGAMVLGDGDPAATVELSSYEWLRTAFGRRSRSQVGDAIWDADPAPYLDALNLFDYPLRDITD